ncbi:hypothetical protein DYB30_004157 [Aphanomyces astaci]|uniref:Uncharacterized protein n=1 Tax=Aphanomyces astaci TaxID=112090 RepID=A0A397DDC9_APHAT|nr:hypothetical protein DYB34_011076 [Aphanomyces astaci]RHY60074.1 hypothetical protein DYB30_004157 [Aphanomyces astaci]
MACKQGKLSLQEFKIFALGNERRARSQRFRAYLRTYEEAVRVALSESLSSFFANECAESSDMDVTMIAQALDDRT